MNSREDDERQAMIERANAAAREAVARVQRLVERVKTARLRAEKDE
jgi:hypothetical protein